MRRGKLFPHNGHNFRSRYEKNQAIHLERLGIKYLYEEAEIDYKSKVYRGFCEDCGGFEVISYRVYTPDFYFPDYGFYVETKGRFTPPDRSKMKQVCTQSTQDIRMVFMRNNYLTKKKKMDYGRWCDINEIAYAVGNIPEEWFK